MASVTPHDPAGEENGSDIDAEARRLRHRLTVLAEAGMTLGSSLDPDQVLRRLGELVVPLVADGCEVALLDARENITRLVFAAGVDEDRVRRRELTPLHLSDAHPIADVLRSGEGVLLRADDDAEGYAFGPREVDTSSRSFGVRQAAVVPLQVRGSVIGALALGVGYRSPVLDDDFLQLANEVAQRAALAYDNARLYVRQRSIADTLQRSLLPSTLPSVEGLDLAARYWTAGSGTEVGGDFYDVFVDGQDPAAPVVVFIGDVCGKGVEAAAVTALARHTLRAAITHLPDPARSLWWLHEAVQARDDDSFVTVVLSRLRVDADGVACDLAIGGHPRPIVVRPDGSTEELSAAGSAPGLPLWRAAPLVTTRLAHGDALIFYTDGLTDVPGSAALTSDDVRALIGGLAGRSAEEMVVELGAYVERLRPRREREDDIAVLVVRAVPVPS